MSKSSANPLMVEQKKKKHLWGLWVPLIVIFSLIFIPVGFVAVLFFDPSHTDAGITDRDRSKDKSQIFSSIMTNMFDGCRYEEDPTIDIVITQSQLNAMLLHAAQNSVTSNAAVKNAPLVGDVNSPIKQFAVLIKEDSRYIFDIEISSYTVLQTHISIETTVTSGVTFEDGKKGYVFDITDLKVGRLRGIESVLPWLLDTTGLDLGQLIQDAAHLNLKYDKDNGRLLYSYEDFVDDLESMASSANPLFIKMFKNFFINDKVVFEHHLHSDTTGTIDMKPYRRNTTYRNDYFIKDYKIGESGDVPMLTYYATSIEDLLNKKVIDDDKSLTKHTSAILKFLAYGQEYLSKSKGELEYVTNIYEEHLKDYYCGGMDMATYSAQRKDLVFGNTSAGLMADVTSKVDAVLDDMDEEEQAAFLDRAHDEGSAYLFGQGEAPYVVPDEKVYTMVKANKNLIGYGFTFVGENNDGNAKVSYTLLDNCYPTIMPAKDDNPNTMALTFGLNINGTETSLAMPMPGTKYVDGGKQGLSFSVKEAPLYFGDELFPDLKEQMQDVINGVSDGDEDGMIQFYKNPDSGNVEEIRMVFDFDDYFEKHPGSRFTKLNDKAKTKGVHLNLEFEFVSLASDEDVTNHRGQFNVSIGYVKD